MNLIHSFAILSIVCALDRPVTAKKNEHKTKQFALNGNPKKLFYPKLTTSSSAAELNTNSASDSMITIENYVKNRHRRNIEEENAIWSKVKDSSSTAAPIADTTSRATTASDKDITSTTENFHDVHEVPTVVQNDFEENCTGEYRFEFRMSDGTRRAEVGEYEERDGRKVFIIRGIFAYTNENKNYIIKAYIIDHLGYHNVPISPIPTTPDGIIDFRPDLEGTDCDAKHGGYCIDQKLLAIMVG